jgi:ElaB/YqjD/DUF883 family membrane-anchored ribosome-binding protein
MRARYRGGGAFSNFNWCRILARLKVKIGILPTVEFFWSRVFWGMNKSDVQDKAQDLLDKAKETAQDLKAQIQDKAKDLQKTAQQWQRKAVKSSRQAAQATDEFVHENPWTVIASVAVGCFAIGFLLGRRRD